MEQRKGGKVIIGIIIGIVSLVIVAAVVVSCTVLPAKRRESQLKEAKNYLEELEYEKAVAAYQALLEVEAKNAELYLGLAEAYVGLGNNQKAVKVLKMGYEETEEKSLKRKMEKLEESLLADAEDGTKEETGESDAEKETADGTETGETDPDETQTSEEAIEASGPQIDEKEWKRAYFRYLSTTDYVPHTYLSFEEPWDLVRCNFSYCDLNGDGIPEILACADSSRIDFLLYYQGGEVCRINLWQEGCFYYNPETGMVCVQAMMGGMAYNMYYKFDGYRLNPIEPDKSFVFREGEDGLEYYWDEEWVSEAEFWQKEKQLGYDHEKEREPQYELDFCSLIAQLTDAKKGSLELVYARQIQKTATEDYIDTEDGCYYRRYQLVYVNDDDVPELDECMMQEGLQSPARYIYACDAGELREVFVGPAGTLYERKDYVTHGEGLYEYVSPIFDKSKSTYYEGDDSFEKDNVEITESEFNEFMASLGEPTYQGNQDAKGMICMLLGKDLE